MWLFMTDKMCMCLFWWVSTYIHIYDWIHPNMGVQWNNCRTTKKLDQISNRPTFDLVSLGVTLISSVLLAEAVAFTISWEDDDDEVGIVAVIDFVSVVVDVVAAAVDNESDLFTADPWVMEEDPLAVLPDVLSFICLLLSISAAAALDAVVVAFVNAPVADELATDIWFIPLADVLDVEEYDDNDEGGGEVFKSLLILILLLLAFLLLLLFKVLLLLFLLLLVLGVSLLVGTGVGVVFVDVVVVVISLKVEPAIDTIGVSGIIAAANEETATATTAAAFGGVVTGNWLLALTTAAMALTVTSNCVEFGNDDCKGADDDDDNGDGIDENDVAVLVVLLLILALVELLLLFVDVIVETDVVLILGDLILSLFIFVNKKRTQRQQQQR